jgi:hypothetical protein
VSGPISLVTTADPVGRADAHHDPLGGAARPFGRPIGAQLPSRLPGSDTAIAVRLAVAHQGRRDPGVAWLEAHLYAQA